MKNTKNLCVFQAGGVIYQAIQENNHDLQKDALCAQKCIALIFSINLE